MSEACGAVSAKLDGVLDKVRQNSTKERATFEGGLPPVFGGSRLGALGFSGALAGVNPGRARVLRGIGQAWQATGRDVAVPAGTRRQSGEVSEESAAPDAFRGKSPRNRPASADSSGTLHGQRR